MDWAGIASEVGEALAEVGLSAELELAAVPGPVTPWDATAPMERERIPVTVMLDGAARKSDAAQIVQADARVIVSTYGLVAAPTVSDRLIVQGVTYQILKVMPLNPGGVAVLYELEVKR